MAKGFLIDLSKCMGCRGCQVACKRYHDLGPTDDDIKATIGKTLIHRSNWTSPADRDADTWLLINFVEMTDDAGDFKWRFVRTGCRHCENPGCVTSCPVGAITKDATTGAVVTDAGKCIGCESCTIGQGLEDRIPMGCPFNVPRYGSKTVSGEAKKIMAKCSMCNDRLAVGLNPACADTCPTGAIQFGEKSAMLTAAEATGLTIYGKDALNADSKLDPGISIYYTSDEPLNKYDVGMFPEKVAVPLAADGVTTPIPDDDDDTGKEEIFPTLGAGAIAAGAVAVAAIGGFALYKRKLKIIEEEGSKSFEDEEEDDDDE
jgi:formate dehydrogenase iron-sulfur subunit